MSFVQEMVSLRTYQTGAWSVDKDVEHTFYLNLHDDEGVLHEDVPCVINNVKIEWSDARDEYVGIFTISIEGSKSYQSSEFYVWGNGHDEEEEKGNFDGCYLCLPTMMEEQPEDWNSEVDGEYDELEHYNLYDMLNGINLDVPNNDYSTLYVPKPWLVSFLKRNFEQSLDSYLSDYTYDSTLFVKQIAEAEKVPVFLY
ncbi:hypothetical protein [Terribacillus saccharophilus]|uniref:hypothetical protein n=1 Tax=Terribacillus saccharophilus TaxID=361277 RepID=UPI002989FB3B|nr:hypothetical protein [Terribacillus saccharophilus]MCM3227495.1 hypothetical protein [Terribacillus saccharophilus]